MTRVELPSCDAVDTAFELTPEQKRELVARLAREGPGALDAWLAERSGKDSYLAAKLAKARAEIERRAKELTERLAAEFEERRTRVRSAHEQEAARYEQAREGVRQEIRLLQATHDERLAEVLRQWEDDVTAAEAKIRGFTKLRIMVVAFLRWLWRILTWPFRAMARGAREEVRGRRERLLALLPGRGAGVALSSDALARAALANPSLRSRLASRLDAMTARERMRFLWRRMLGLENYGTLAMALMEESLRQREREIGEAEAAMSRRLEELSEEESAARGKREQELEALWKRREEEMQKLAERLRDAPREKVRNDLVAALEDSGLVRQRGGEIAITSRLVDRFSEIVYAEELAAMPASRHATLGGQEEGEGIYEKERMLSVYELSRMDLVESKIQARVRHPHVRHIFDDDILVYREWRSSSTHVVIVFDRSGSMEENERLDAAKRAVLVLHRAAKRASPDNRVDVIEMETSVRKVDLLDTWLAKPRGFTNTGGALRLAAEMLESSRADRRIVYLITDGLPEARTEKGQDFADRPERCLDYALRQARRLRDLRGVQLMVVLLEPQDAMFVEAAQAIAAEVDGTVVETDPAALVREVFVDFDARLAVGASASAAP